MPAEELKQPVLLLLGPETGKKSDYVKKLYKQCCDACGGSSELHRFYAFDTEDGEAMEVLRNSSLFADHRFVVISQADKLSASMVSQILAYVKSPDPDALLVLISSEYSVNKKLQQAVGKDRTVMFWELFENQKKEWLQRHFSAKGMDITHDAVELFLELVENNTQEMRSVADQFSSYLITLGLPDPVMITEEEVDSFVYHSKQESVFTLFAKLASRDLAGSLDIFNTMQLAGEFIPAAFFGGLFWQFRRLQHFLELLRDRWTPEEAMAKTEVLGNKAAITGKRNKAVYAEAAEHYTVKDVRSILMQTQQCESMLREIRSDMHPLIVELLLYRIIRRSGRAPLPGEAYYGLIGVNYPDNLTPPPSVR